MDLLAAILGSRTRTEIFRLLFQHAESELYLRQLHRMSSLSIRPIQQELSKLVDVGLVKFRSDGNRVYYSANSAHPLFPEIRGLVEKTSGVWVLLEEALQDARVELAFVFGSVASGTARPDSDLDLFVIGEIGLRGVVKLISGMSDRAGREINPHVMTRAEFVRKTRGKNHFVSSVLGSPKKFVIGSDDELGRLGQKRLAPATQNDGKGARRSARDRRARVAR
jgi:predicted nucleotidyltransferase